MTPGTFTISFGQFEDVFPFFFVVDRRMRIVACGRSLAKLGCQPSDEDGSFQDLFNVVRPRVGSSFDDLARRANMLFVLDLPGKMRMRGHTTCNGRRMNCRSPTRKTTGAPAHNVLTIS